MSAKHWYLVGLAVSLTVLAVTWHLRSRPPIRIERADGLELRHRLFGFSPDDEQGHSVGGVGDVDADGHADFVAGAPHHDEDSGRARLYSGRTGAVLFEWRGEPGDNFGVAVNGAGDVDADGTPDVVVGLEREQRRGPGSARVFSGRTGAELYTFTGELERDLFGHSVAAAGDIDGDGHGDVVVGAPGSWKKESVGYARVFSGKDGRTLFTFRGERFPGDRFGFSVAGAGDANRDGRPDVLIGALGDTGRGSHSGRVYLFSGADGRKLRTIDGDATWHELGHAVASAGDLDGDGHPDLLAGAFLQKGIGYARAFSGRTGRTLLEVKGLEVADAFGHSIAGALDADGDGIPDLVAGAPDATISGAPRTGYVRIYSGADGRVLLERSGTRERMHYGYVVAAAGDVNGDFLDDVLVGTVLVGEPGVVEVVSACAVEPARVEGELTLVRIRDGFLAGGGPEGAAGALEVAQEGEALLSEPFTFGADPTPIRFSMRRPELAGRTTTLRAVVQTGTVALRSPEMKVRFCR